MQYRFIRYDETAAPGARDSETIGVLTLDRPERRNALGPRMAL